MAAKALSDEQKAALGRWFETFQGFAVPAEALYDPSRGSGLGEMVKAAARKLPFESEPSEFLDLLYDLAPEEALPEDENGGG